LRTGLAAVRGERALAAIQRWASYGVPRLPSGLLPAVVSRQGLRSNTVGWDGPPGDRPARVMRIDPADGATGVFLDDPVVASLSHPADPASATAETFRVADDAGDVPGHLRLSSDARVLVWTPERLLCPGIEHTVTIAGLRDLRGREMAPHASRFAPCRFSARDVMS
jgi:Big-like domain-containing protein